MAKVRNTQKVNSSAARAAAPATAASLRAAASQAVSDAGSRPSSAENLNQTAVVNQQTQPAVRLDEMTDDQKLAYLDEKERTDTGLTDEEKGIKDQIHTQNENKQKKRKIGEIDGPMRDPDWGKPEKTKFDIQQGDIIDFMMKEIILAAAAEAGDKFFGYVGSYTYQSLSELYHSDTLKNIRKGAVEMWDDTWKKPKKSASSDNTESTDPGTPPAPAPQSPDHPGPVPEGPAAVVSQDSATDVRSFFEQIRQFRASTIRYNEVLYNQEVLSSLLEKACSPQWENSDQLTEPEKAFLRQPQHANTRSQLDQLHQVVHNTGYDPAKVENIRAHADQNMRHNFILAESMNVVAADYAAAAMTEKRLRDPNAFQDPQKLESDYQIYLIQGKKIYLHSAREIFDNKPVRSYKDLNSLLESSEKAFADARRNVSEKVPLPNAELDKLNDIWSRQKDHHSKPQTLEESAVEQNTVALSINQMMAEADNDLKAALAAREDNNQKKSRVERAKQKARVGNASVNTENKDSNASGKPVVNKNRER